LGDVSETQLHLTPAGNAPRVQSGDEGIDGIINEDKLRLDVVYI
jgi:restriction endonuclease Mrr